MDIEIGISEDNRQGIADALGRLLADTYILYLKTQNFHWNVTGMHFQSLHTLFEGQYEALAEAVDEIAEQIRTLGFFAPGTFAEFSRMASIEEDENVPDAPEMIRQLVKGQEAVIRTARSIMPLVAEAEDESSASLLAERIAAHEKAAWMLRSLLD